jgi:hypothetical protein
MAYILDTYNQLAWSMVYKLTVPSRIRQAVLVVPVIFVLVAHVIKIERSGATAAGAVLLVKGRVPSG